MEKKNSLCTLLRAELNMSNLEVLFWTWFPPPLLAAMLFKGLDCLGSNFCAVLSNSSLLCLLFGGEFWSLPFIYLLCSLVIEEGIIPFDDFREYAKWLFQGDNLSPDRKDWTSCCCIGNIRKPTSRIIFTHNRCWKVIGRDGIVDVLF